MIKRRDHARKKKKEETKEESISTRNEKKGGINRARVVKFEMRYLVSNTCTRGKIFRVLEEGEKTRLFDK